MRTAAYTDDGRSTVPLMTASKIAMRPAEYRYGIEHGLRVSFQITLPSPGPWQIRAVVADGTSDRVGSATQFVEIPDWQAGASLGDVGTWYCAVRLRRGLGLCARSRECGLPMSRIFKPGGRYTFSYAVFGALVGMDKQSAFLEVQTRIFADGRVGL